MSKKLELKEKIKIDAARTTDKERRTIHLFREGSFYRLLNYSVWLHTVLVYNEAYRSQIDAKQPLAIRKNMTKGDNVFIIGGFPVRSTEKYSGGMEFNVIDDTRAEIVIPEDVDMDFTDEEYEQKYQEFFDAIELEERKPIDAYSGSVRQDGCVARKGLIDIMRDIMQFQLVEHTPSEAVDFVRSVQRDLNKLM